MELLLGMSLRALVIGVVAVLAVLRVSPIASAETVPLYGIVTSPHGNGRSLARQVLPVPDTVDFEAATDQVEQAVIAQSRVIYLNKNGVTLLPGDNDSRTNHSTIVTAQTAIAGWNVSPTDWQATVSCMRELFAAYDVTLTELDPGNVPHIEAVFGGTPQQVGADSTVVGLSPFTLDCSIIENSIVFTFANSLPLTPREACETMAQEVAHSFGLDHELLASDPMTYLPYGGNRAFRDQAATCGEDSAAPRPCGINGSVCRQNQNSVQLLRERLGAAKSTGAPTTPTGDQPNGLGAEVEGGCAAGGGHGSALLGLGLVAALTARRRRRR